MNAANLERSVIQRACSRLFMISTTSPELPMPFKPVRERACPVAGPGWPPPQGHLVESYCLGHRNLASQAEAAILMRSWKV